MKLGAWVFLVLAAVLGVLYQFIATMTWGVYVSSDFALGLWLPDILRSGTALFWVGVYTHDAIVNILLAVPFAIVFIAFRGLNNWQCVCLAVLAGLVATYWGVDWTNFDFAGMAQSTLWWAGTAMQLFSLPIAFVAIRAIRRHQSGTPPPTEARGRAAA